MDKPKEKIHYSILENKDNQAEAVILKEGMNTTFTIKEIAEARVYLKKKKVELESEVRVNEAAKQNVLGTHPFVKKLNEKDLIAAALFGKYSQVVKDGLSKLQEIDDQLKEYDQELTDIAQQTGLQTQINSDNNVELFIPAKPNAKL